MVPFVQLFRSSAFRPVVPLNGPYFGGTCVPPTRMIAQLKKSFHFHQKTKEKFAVQSPGKLSLGSLLQQLSQLLDLILYPSQAILLAVMSFIWISPLVPLLLHLRERERANKHRENDFPPTRREFVTDANDRSVPVVDFLVIFELSSCVTS